MPTSTKMSRPFVLVLTVAPGEGLAGGEGNRARARRVSRVEARVTKLVREALATEDLRGQPRRKGRRKGKHCVKRRRAVRAARQNALASAVARTWKVSKKERVAAANMAAEVIGRAVKNWREATVARRATAAEMIGRTIKRWTETMPCWIENWRTVLAVRYEACLAPPPSPIIMW
jgi:hypothetical protein